MFDSGNFALYNKNDSIIWETFRYPTDTIIGGQLFSSASETNHSTGRYRLKMQYDGNFVLELANTVDDASEVYWESLPGGYSRNRYGRNGYGLNKYCLVLNDAGLLQIINSTSMESVQNFTSLESNNSKTIYRATLDVGVFRLYSHAFC